MLDPSILSDYEAMKRVSCQVMINNTAINLCTSMEIVQMTDIKPMIIKYILNSVGILDDVVNFLRKIFINKIQLTTG